MCLGRVNRASLAAYTVLQVRMPAGSPLSIQTQRLRTLRPILTICRPAATLVALHATQCETVAVPTRLAMRCPLCATRRLPRDRGYFNPAGHRPRSGAIHVCRYRATPRLQPSPTDPLLMTAAFVSLLRLQVMNPKARTRHLPPHSPPRRHARARPRILRRSAPFRHPAPSLRRRRLSHDPG